MLPIREIKNINSLIQTYPIRYDAVEHITATYNNIATYHRPQYSDQVSLGQTGVVLTDTFEKFLNNDKKLRALIGLENEFTNLPIKEIYKKSPQFTYSLIRQRSKEYSLGTMLTLIKNVLKATNEKDTDEIIKQKVCQIYKDNYNTMQQKFGRNAFYSFSLYQNRMALNNKNIDKSTKEILLSVIPKNKEKEM